ncbi:MAG TPA: cupredoxin domain-containing protein [Anaerolineales bacterium]|nr:cupredoxin domain-containing protein [Anaerolineales bacterium]
MKARPRSLVLPAIALIAFLVAGCGPKPVTFNVEMSDFKFTPAAFEADGGADVTLVLSNVASVEHEWVLFEKDYQVTLPFDDDDEGHIYWEGEVEPGETQTFTFVAPEEPGQYQVTCGVAGHAEAGMFGTFTVR